MDSPLFRLILKTFGAAFLLNLLFFSSILSAEEPRFGLWVESEGTNRPFDTKEHFERFLEISESGRFSDLYCQVYRRGRAWFPTLIADDLPYRTALRQGFDPLKDTIEAVHKKGGRVHAWLNVLRVQFNRDAALFKLYSEDAPLVDSYGNSLLSYEIGGSPPGEIRDLVRLGTPGYWLDPSSQKVRSYIVELVRALVTNYPELDGIHLDMLRFPMIALTDANLPIPKPLTFGYSERAKEHFAEYQQITGRTTVSYTHLTLPTILLV